MVHRVPDEVLFCAISVGYTTGWTALSSTLGYLKAVHGAVILLQLNAAFFAPSLPLLVLQVLFDYRFDKQYGAGLATLVRQGLSLTAIALSCVVLPFLDWTQKGPLMLITAIIGAAASIAFGSSYQIVARFPASCTQALSIGFVSSGPFILLLQALLRIGPHPSHAQLRAFFLIAALLPVLAGYCAALLLLRHWESVQARSVLQFCDRAPYPRQVSLHRSGPLDPAAAPEPRSLHMSDTSTDLQRAADGSALFEGNPPRGHHQRHGSTLSEASPRGSDASEAAARLPLLAASAEPSTIHMGDVVLHTPRHGAPKVGALLPTTSSSSSSSSWRIRDSMGPVGLGLLDIVREVLPLALCISSSICVSIMLFCLFTAVRSSGGLSDMLPQALFAARMVADVLGRVASRHEGTTLRKLKVLAVVKFLMMPVAVLYLRFPQELLSDVAAVGFAAVHWFLSGVINTWSYMLAPHLLENKGDAARAGAVLSACFQVATVAGLLLAAAVEQYWLAGATDHLHIPGLTMMLLC